MLNSHLLYLYHDFGVYANTSVIYASIQSVDRVNFAHRNEAPDSEFQRADNDTSAANEGCFIALSYLPQSRNCQFMGYGFDSVVCTTFYGLSYRVTSYANHNERCVVAVDFISFIWSHMKKSW